MKIAQKSSSVVEIEDGGNAVWSGWSGGVIGDGGVAIALMILRRGGFRPGERTPWSASSIFFVQMAGRAGLAE